MTLDIVNADNETVGSLELSDEVFGGRPRLYLVWESVVRENASERRGTHKTKNRAAVSGTGRKPWRQKGTGRARVGEARNPLWRKGGTVFGPQPRSYDYAIPRKVERGALTAALAGKFGDRSVVIIDRLDSAEGRTKDTAGLVKRLGATGRTLFVDVSPDTAFVRSAQNLDGVRVVASGRLTPRDVVSARTVVLTQAAAGRLEAVLSGSLSRPPGDAAPEST